MSRNKVVGSILLPILGVTIIFWSRYGNLKELMRDNPSAIGTILCIVTILVAIFFWFKSRTVLWLIVPLIFSSVPISFLIGNPLDLSMKFLIIYCVGMICLFTIFQNEIRKFISR